jgi:alpha-amylase/alpha-mannosidase (GH57 family)
MPRRITLALGVHNHQPVGNFDFVFENACQKAYLPFLKILEGHPHIRMALHYSGPLLRWLQTHHPECIEILRHLVKRGQVEMLTGGLYEPILPIIPDVDKVAQIQGLSKAVEKVFGSRPVGMWLAERVWEPHLPLPLARAGVKYSIIDDSHFKYAGLADEDLLGYYITEEQGALLALFPISKKLRYTIPFQEPEETIEHLRSLATEDGEGMVVFADDGEKFGVWPETHRHCYEDRWLERFFGQLAANAEWIEIRTFGELIGSRPALGRVYLPTASYAEMMKWALPARAIPPYEEFQQKLQEAGQLERYGVYVRGGFWRSFLAKYPESNNMHKKMLAVSRKVIALADKKGESPSVRRAREELFQGQCNDAYWHGVFGGLYLNHLRWAIYHHLLEAEKIADGALHQGKGWLEAQTVDFDGDGAEEILVHTPDLNLYFDPEEGGSLFELDFKPLSVNLLDTLARRQEGYHSKLSAPSNRQPTTGDVTSIHDRVLAKEEGLEKFLCYDRYRRVSLLDHFLAPGTSLEAFSRGQHSEHGDFLQGIYQFRLRRQKNRLTLRLFREGSLRAGEQPLPLLVSKIVDMPAQGSVVGIRYRLENRASRAISCWFGVEFNFALLAGNAPDRYYWVEGVQLEEPHLASTGETADVRSFGLRDEYLGLDISLTLDKPATLWRFPIETISQSEGGFERIYQSSVVFPNWKLQLKAGESWEVKIRQEIVEL